MTLGEMELGGSFPEREGAWREKGGGRMRLCYVDGEERQQRWVSTSTRHEGDWEKPRGMPMQGGIGSGSLTFSINSTTDNLYPSVTVREHI